MQTILSSKSVISDSRSNLLERKARVYRDKFEEYASLRLTDGDRKSLLFIFDRIFTKYGHLISDVRSGKNRCTFILPDSVIKLPITYRGYEDNEHEAWQYRVTPYDGHHEHYVQYAKCRALYYDVDPYTNQYDLLDEDTYESKKDQASIRPVPVVFMEKVTYADAYEIEDMIGCVPEWVYDIDQNGYGYQVGFNREGILVAYDYGKY